MMAMYQTLLGLPASERIEAVEQVLRGPGGRSWRTNIARWISQMVPAETLVPEGSKRWRPLVRDAFEFVFARLSDGRLAAKVAEQIELPVATPPERRLLRLLTRMPGLQKMGQVLARNHRLDLSLRNALTELENGISDVTASEIRALIVRQLGQRLEEFEVNVDPAILSEASVSAVIRFTWKSPGKEREPGVFKVLKPFVPVCFAEDMRLLQDLGEHLAVNGRGYEFAVDEVREILSEVRLLLEHELDFSREQATLGEAEQIYSASIGIRVPRLIAPLCTARITAMSAENGIKVTQACRRSQVRRDRIAGQLIEALLAVPLFSRVDNAVFHADPHAGNLLYDEPNRELVVLDWALAERLSRADRRNLVMLAAMMVLRNPQGVAEAIHGLSLDAKRSDTERGQIVDRAVERFFHELPRGSSPGTLDGMMLLDRIALEGVHFPPPLFLFRKVVFTLDGVLRDVAGSAVQMDRVVAREFITRCAASFGLFHSPLGLQDFAAVQWNALLYPARARGWLAEPDITDSARASHGSIPNPPTKSPRPAKSHRPARPRRRSRPTG